jgi:hypothetical protein
VRSIGDFIIADARRFLLVCSGDHRLQSESSGIAGRRCEFRTELAGEFFEYAEHVAEPDRCTEPPFALGTGALEF